MMQYNSLEDIFGRFSGLRALVIGDVMLDAYLWGDVSRISPEAPVPIVNVKKRENRLGGAANVALNVQALGGEPVLCAAIGNDEKGKAFLHLLEHSKLSTQGIISSQYRPTTVKERVLAGHQQILRIDDESTNLLNDTEREELWLRIQSLLPSCQVVIFEDYDKGVLDQSIIQRTIALAQANNIPTVVDPKKRNFLYYKGATLFKPNLKELREGLKIDFTDALPDIQQAVKQLRQALALDYALVTLSEKGIYLDGDQVEFAQPAHLRSIADVSGAGDTVVSVAALCMALGINPRLTASLANLAGGLVCEYVGVVSIDKQRLLEEAIKNRLWELVRIV